MFTPNFSEVCIDTDEIDSPNSSYSPLLPLQDYCEPQQNDSVPLQETGFLDLRIVEGVKTQQERTESVKGKKIKLDEEVRTPHPEQWKRNLRKFNKNHGLQYMARTGTVEPEKKMGPPCQCRMRCFESIGQEACNQVFANFWKLGDYSLQNTYLAGCVRISRSKMFQKKQPSRRNFTRCFYITADGVDTEICKKAFLSLHSVSNGRLDRLLKKKQKSGIAGVDARGKHNNKVNRVPSDKINEVHKSIDDFRRFAGYTGEAQSDILEIIPAPYNIRTMYRNYCQVLESEGKTPVTEFRFRKILETDYNIDFANRYLSSNQESPKYFESQGTQTTDDKIAYTTVDNQGNTYVAFSPDVFGDSEVPTQGWTFVTE